jgi:hypothetical protein
MGLVVRMLRLAACVVLLGIVLDACATSRERCESHGGRVISTRGGREACQARAADAGKSCRDKRDCSIACLCTGELGFPGAEDRAELEKLEGTAQAGECAAYAPAPGSGWQCVIADGRVMRRGIIVD